MALVDILRPVIVPLKAGGTTDCIMDIEGAKKLSQK